LQSIKLLWKSSMTGIVIYAYCDRTVITEDEEGGFIALNPETGTTTQGETYQEAINNLKEAPSLYLDEFSMKIHSHPVMTTFEVRHA